MPWKDPLTFGVHMKDYPTVERLMSDGQSPNGRLDGHTTLLHMAVYSNDLRMTRLLVDHNADVNTPDNTGKTPLFISSEPQVSTEITQLLLVNGAKLVRKDSFNRTPIHYMSFYHQTEKLPLLLMNTDAALLNELDFFGNTALHMCIYSENPNHKYCTSTLQCLLQAGADPDIQDSRGRNVLHHVSDKLEPLTELVLAARPNVNYQLTDKAGNTFLHKLVCNLVLSDTDWFELFDSSAISKHHWRTLLNSKNLCGQTPFFIYLDLQFYQESVIFKMLELGADANLSDDLGVTPLMRACTFSFETTRALIESGVDLNVRNIYGQTALHLAKDYNLASYLIESGADINICDNWGRSPFQQSILSASDLNTTEDVQKLLLAKGASIDHQDMFGSTAMHLAAFGNYELITCLLDMGANPHLTDACGRVPLDIARQYNKEAEELLQDTSQRVDEKMDMTTCADEASIGNAQLLYVFKEVEQICKKLVKDGATETRSTFQKVNCAVTELMKSIATNVGEIDPVFVIEVCPSGSSAEGTKAELPDEFDFVYCLPFFAESCEIVEANSEMSFGLVRLKAKTNLPPEQVAHLFDDYGYLSAYKVRNELEGLIHRVIRTKSTWDIDNIKMGGLALSFERDPLAEKPVINFKISYIDKEYSNLEISIDVALGIRMSAWWPSYINVDSIPLADDTIKMMGCLLIAQVPGDKSDRNKMLGVVSMREDGQACDGLSNPTTVDDDTFKIRAEHVSAYSNINELVMQIVREPEETCHDNNTMERRAEGTPDFRISVSLCESYAMRRLPQSVKNGYILAKILKQRICPDIDFEEGNDTRIIEQLLFSSAKDFIKSYLLKNCLFHILSSDVEIIYARDDSDSKNCLLDILSSDDVMYTRDSNTSEDKTQQVADVAMAIYRYLSGAAAQKSLRSHFLPMVDLFKYQRIVLEGHTTEDFDEYLDDITYKIHMYCQSILGCMRSFSKQTR